MGSVPSYPFGNFGADPDEVGRLQDKLTDLANEFQEFE